jgi:hypothetical protein
LGHERLVAYFDQKNPYAALVETMPFTGLHAGQAIGLRCGVNQ